MHIGFLGAADSWYLADLRRAAADRHEVTPVRFADIASTVGPAGVTVSAGGVSLAQFDAVLVRAMPPGSLEQVVFRMDALARLEALGTPVVNAPRAIEVAVDKYLATARLAEAGLLVPETVACQTVVEALTAFEKLGRDVVIKPLFGSEGRGITRLSDPALAERAFGLLIRLGAVVYVQRYVPHEGYDVRVLVIGERLLAMRRRNPLDWRTNVSRGAIAEPFELTPQMADMARRAAAAVGAEIAGVDLLPGLDGAVYAIEVNAVPGWKALAAALKLDVAQVVLSYIESRGRSRRRACALFGSLPSKGRAGEG